MSLKRKASGPPELAFDLGEGEYEFDEVTLADKRHVRELDVEQVQNQKKRIRVLKEVRSKYRRP